MDRPVTGSICLRCQKAEATHTSGVATAYVRDWFHDHPLVRR